MADQAGSKSFTSAKRVVRKPGDAGFRGSFLFFLPLPLLAAIGVSLGRGNFTGVVGNTAAAILFFVGAMALRRGLREEREYHRKKVAVAPVIPFKLGAAVAVGLATLLAADIGAGHGFAVAVCFGIGAALGCLLTYGTDPRKEKVAEAGYGYTTAEVVEVLEEAEVRVVTIDQARAEIHNQELRERLSRIAEAARKVLSALEEDPRDIRRARKFLNTYLQGAQRVIAGYAATHAKTESQELETNFRNVLTTIEEVFNQQHEKLLQNDVLDLDVQIEVLAMQLKREGVL